MKRLYILALTALLIGSASAQNCNPDQSITDPGIYPEALDTSWVGQAYTFTMNVLAIKDTQVVFAGTPQTANIDSIVLQSVEGLPGNFGYSCEPVRCVYDYTAVGCVLLSGTPAKADIGVHNLNIYTKIFAKVQGFSVQVNDTIRDYRLVVRDSGAASIHQLTSNEVSLYPNPVQDGEFSLSTQGDIQFIEVFDARGRAVEYTANRQGRLHRVQLEGPKPGVYFVHVKMGNTVVKKRIMVL